MKKVFGVVAVVLVVAAGWFGWNYYQSTYVAKDAYAVVPTEVPAKTKTKNDAGKVVPDSYSYLYKITFVDEDGKSSTRTVEISGDSPEPLTPGKYIKAGLSAKRIVEGPNYVEESAVPDKVLKLIKK